MTSTANPLASPLFTPFRFGAGELANRIVMAPMTRGFSPNGIPGEDMAAYYRSRTEGGVGLIITEGAYIEPAANGFANVPAFYGEAALAGWRHVVEQVHAAGGKIIPQLWHVGAKRRPGTEPEPGVPGYGPMAIEENGKTVVQAMTQADIQRTINAYAEAAANAERLGFDGVELHGAHGYLIDQFLWMGSNQRRDEYGGSVANRLRFALEVVAAVRARVSENFPLVLRFSQWKTEDYDAKLAQTPEELAAILQPLAAAGVDIFHASTRRLWEPAFEGSPDNLATWARKLTGKPVITVGSVGLDKTFDPNNFFEKNSYESKSKINLPELAERVRQQEFDLVAVGRALLSDPQWANKVRDGRLDELINFDEKALYTLVV